MIISTFDEAGVDVVTDKINQILIVGVILPECD